MQHFFSFFFITYYNNIFNGKLKKLEKGFNKGNSYALLSHFRLCSVQEIHIYVCILISYFLSLKL